MTTRISEAHEFLNNLAGEPPRLPFDPALLSRLFQGMSDNSHMPLDELSGLVERSQALAAKVLSVANSACYGLQGNVTSLIRAVQVLGIMELRSLVLFFSVTGAIPRSDLPREFPTQALWEHQIRTALLGRLLAQIVNTMPANSNADKEASDPDSVYAAGILHDLGKVVLAARKPEAWSEISALSRDRPCDFATAEEEYWGIDHGTVAAILLKAWDLPDLLTEMISWHHHPDFCANYTLEVHILAAANRLAVLGLDSNGNIPEVVFDLLPQYAELLRQNVKKLQQTLQHDRPGVLAAFAT